MITESTLPDPYLPNSDWQTALTLLETSLPEDLFRIVTTTSEMSSFVHGVFCRYPQLAAKALLWQKQYSDQQVISQMADVYRSFGGHNSPMNVTQISSQLRLFRRVYSAAIAVLELSGQLSIESSCARISILADCLIKTAYHWCYENLHASYGHPVDDNGQRQNLLIIAMGKLGGRELNFSSDVDLIFFYPQPGKTIGGTKSIENTRFFQRLSTQLIKLLDEVTAEGFVYRVDMRLRPYGDSGALSMSFAQAEDYYQEQGREWERFAMIRARTLTGTSLEQKALDEIIRPFSFRRYIDYGVIESIRNMKEMIQREVRRKKLVGNIKLGAGGIREVEFIVQSLQLIQGGRDKRLREKNTLLLIPLLVEAKLLPEDVAGDLASSYRFLRRVEHCLQELVEKQTQQLPDNTQEQDALCSAMGYSNWKDFTDELNSLQSRVHSHFNELFGEKRKEALAQDDFHQSLAEGHIDATQLQQHMQQLPNARLLSSDQSEAFVSRLHIFTGDAAVVNLSPRGAKRLKTFFPALLAACLLTEEPEITLERLLRVLQAILKRTAYLELLSENPPILQHLVDLAGASPWIVSRLSDYPVLFDELLYPNSLYEPLQTADLLSELQQSLLRVNPQDEEELLETIRAFKQTNELRVAAALLSKRLSISQVSRYLTQLAEVILQAAVKQCWLLLQLKYGVPVSLRDDMEGADSDASGIGASGIEKYGFAIIGYGKLGGFELGFGSDLDLVFLFDQPVEGQTNGKRSISNSRFYTRLAQKIIHFLSTRTNLGLLYEVDMRLRPSGSSGLLVSHVDAYRDYQLDSAWTWEHQALVRARFVAGDESLRDTFDTIRFEVLAKKRDKDKLRSDVRDMREKMRSQLEVKQQGKVDLKQSHGGLIDIEFLSQYFCLIYQGTEALPHGTVQGLEVAATQGWLQQQDLRTLVKSYRLFRNRLNEMALLSGDKLVDEGVFVEQRESVEMIWGEVFGANGVM